MFLKTLNRFLCTHSMLVLYLQFRPRRIVMHPPHALSAAAHTVLMVAMFSRTLSSSIVTTVETANRFDGMLPLEPPPSLAQTAKSRCHTLVSMQSKLMGWSKTPHIVPTLNPGCPSLSMERHRLSFKDENHVDPNHPKATSRTSRIVAMQDDPEFSTDCQQATIQAI